MHSEINDYGNDSNNNNEQDKFPGQSIQVCALSFEHVEYDEIGQGDD